jgi:hypothetical protein
MKLLLALIYKGELANLLDLWLVDFSARDEAYFAATLNGWSCDSLRLQWLQKGFHSHTKDKARNRLQLLIVDGHSNYVNLSLLSGQTATRS